MVENRVECPVFQHKIAQRYYLFPTLRSSQYIVATQAVIVSMSHKIQNDRGDEAEELVLYVLYKQLSNAVIIDARLGTGKSMYDIQRKSRCSLRLQVRLSTPN